MSTAYGVTEPGAEKSPRKSVLIGADGKVVAAYDTVKPPEHPDQVLADLDKLT
jgi:peroxiredoxin